MDGMEIALKLLKGVLNNTLITFLAVILPLTIGVPLSILANKVKILRKIFSWANIPFEALSVPLLMLFIFYFPGLILGTPFISRFSGCVLGLTVAYLFYMPARYNDSYSCIKNILYNGLGVISNVFKWSLISGSLLLCPDVLSYTKEYLSYGLLWPFFITFIVVGAILGTIEIIRVVIKQFMK